MFSKNCFSITYFNQIVERFHDYHSALLSNSVANTLHVAGLSLV